MQITTETREQAQQVERAINLDEYTEGYNQGIEWACHYGYINLGLIGKAARGIAEANGKGEIWQAGWASAVWDVCGVVHGD